MRARDNPYRVERLHAVTFRLQGGDRQWGALHKRLQAQGMRGCIVGPHGSGKTTLLLAICRFLRHRGYAVRWLSVQVGEDEGPPAGTSLTRALNPFGWKRPGLRLWTGGIRGSLNERRSPRASDRAKFVLIVDGADLLSRLQWRRVRREARGHGLLASSHHRVLLPILYRCTPSVQVLESLMSELHPGTTCGQPSAAELFPRHQGNLREAFWELYDVHAKMPDRVCSAAQNGAATTESLSCET